MGKGLEIQGPSGVYLGASDAVDAIMLVVAVAGGLAGCLSLAGLVGQGGGGGVGGRGTEPPASNTQKRRPNLTTSDKSVMLAL